VLLLGILACLGACAEREKAIPRVEITTPVGEQTGDVIVSYVLYDKEGLPASIKVECSVDGGTRFKDATEGAGGDGTANLSSSLRGVAHSYVWNSLIDVGAANHNDIRIKITPTTRREGEPALTGSFTVKNFVFFSDWAENLRIDGAPAGFSAETPCICADATAIYAVWADNRDGDYDIFYSLSADGGDNWSTPLKANDVLTGNQRNPAIATDNAGKVYLVWEDNRDGDYNIHISVGSDSGTGFSFGASARVDDGAAGDATAPAIAVDGNTIYVAWADSRDDSGDIYLRRSTDGAASWDDAIRVNNPTTGLQRAPALYADGSGKIFAVWADARNGNSDIYFDWASDSGGVLVFAGNQRIDTDTTGRAADLPSICGSAINVYVFWSDARTDSGDIYFRCSADSGANWGDEKKVNTDAGTAFQIAPVCLASGANVYLVWQDSRDGNPDIYFSESADSGVTFSPEVRVDDDVTSAAQSVPVVSIQGVSPVVLFQDTRSGDTDIYFTKK
jgi:hypothetical protein